MGNVEDHSDGGLFTLVFVIISFSRRMYLTEGEEDDRVKQGNGKKQ